jgi:hypothetical protein
LGRRLEEIIPVSQEPSGPVIALCRGWPNARVLEKLWAQARGRSGWGPSPLASWLLGLKASPAQFVDYTTSLPRQMQRDRIWTFPAETIRAVRDRLQRDSDSRQRLLDAIKVSDDNDIIATGARLLGARREDADNRAARCRPLRQARRLPLHARSLEAGRISTGADRGNGENFEPRIHINLRP